VTGEWSRFASALNSALAALPAQGVLIVGDRVNGQYFVQYAHGGDHIRAEAAGGPDEAGRPNLTEQQGAELAAIGWQPPDQRHFNWWHRLDWPATSAQYAALAEMSARALSEAYGVASPATLEYESWIDGTLQPLDFPQLGIARSGGRAALPLARTNLEAHLYLDLHPCECGEAGFDRQSSVIEQDGELASRYSGSCDNCGRPREFIFRLPAEIMVPTPGEPRYGGDQPSELIDPGEWLAVADAYARSASAPGPELDQARRASSRTALARAGAALDEVLKFVPRGADAVPESAFWTERGNRVYATEPGRFRASRLTAVRDAYRRMLTELGADRPS
jgi:hypothetical protein